MRVKIFVTPRRGILDPQGRAVESALKSLGFANVGGVHVGRYIVLDIDAASIEETRAMVGKMCDQLLANPLIEDYAFEVEPA
ncbi:MAG: phosphoribosylformylglycinamidine synthase subunit PurS [Candidatus Binataceae bacterium]